MVACVGWRVVEACFFGELKGLGNGALSNVPVRQREL